MVDWNDPAGVSRRAGHLLLKDRLRQHRVDTLGFKLRLSELELGAGGG